MKRGNVKSLALLLAGIMTVASVAGVQPVNVTAEEAATEEVWRE